MAIVNRRAAFEVVDKFEEALCEFTGAPFAVAVDSCTNALFLSLLYMRHERGERKSVLADSFWRKVDLPRRTYVGVAQAVKNAGFRIEWRDEAWVGEYMLRPHRIIDAAKRFERGMYQRTKFHCVSFQAAKLLPIGRGGAILHDNPEADEWLRKARFDGRTEGADYKNPTFQTPGFHCYMTPPDAARGLWLLTYLEDWDQGDWTEYPDLSEATWT